jgi:cell wall-associated NlpC family hydrolase
MPLSPELSALVDQAEATLIDARIALTEFRSANSGTPQKIDHSDYMAIWVRSQSQPWTVTDKEQAILSTATGIVTADDFATLHEAPGSSWNPSAATKRRGREFAAMGEAARAATFAKATPVKDKKYYRQLWMRGGGSTARAECIAHAGSKNMALWQYKSWLWADEPRAATPGATPSAVAWAERQLRSA